MSEINHQVVVVGAGFGGLEFTRALAEAPVRITMIDKRNHHLFQPLLYQVATTALATSEIAWPIRHLLRKRRDVTTLLANVVGIDRPGKRVMLDDGSALAYDTLVLATGARHAYFGHEEWEPFAPGLKTLEDATTIRRRILLAFEQAERETDPVKRQALLTVAIVGGGPTGVELAGTIVELAHDTLRGEFRNIDTRSIRVVLIEAGDRVLANFAPEHSDYAEKALERLGVTIELGRAVTRCDADGVVFGDKELAAKTILWAAGVAASPAAEWLGAEADRAGRVLVAPDLTVPGNPEIFVIGDAAHVLRPDGRPVPGVAPAAKQQGKHVAALLKARLAGDATPRPFRYRHDGDLATIGKRAAVIDLGWLKLTGWPAWWLWGVAHIYFLIGFRNRLAVSLSWLWIYATGQRSARLITQGDEDKV
ncbi:NAD(P)/FAD-dependent oxidoreductase [Mesorhizobium sp. ES1-1]|uniref:NAD(P)/FAD-dependent oxidoreductase n=1 Tax=Mesorhizobium sp. ES1-1 TaxID=2876629 RepID=UPI001CCCADF1|nr:NAD(P)/FAD-dependent oxidoreductase [Mesorhizobium sp. ES1-1]MBZ9677041.1 NAD(P)/FAD-dependent oxidoreductase [Mesorhizobium sp. ES1-1]